MEALLLVLGALVGAMATGGVNTWIAWRLRLLHRKVAARVILGDMFVIEAAIEVIQDLKKWPDRFDYAAPQQTWRESREAFAAAVKSWEWALVDGVYSNFSRTALMARPGERCTPGDLEVLAELRDRIVGAREIALGHAVPKGERDRLVEEMLRRKTPQVTGVR